jgi:hypothetical protein
LKFGIWDLEFCIRDFFLDFNYIYIFLKNIHYSRRFGSKSSGKVQEIPDGLGPNCPSSFPDLGPNRPELFMDGLGKPSIIGYGQFGPNHKKKIPTHSPERL